MVVEPFGEPTAGASRKSRRRLVVLAIVVERGDVGAYPLQVVAETVVGGERLFHLGFFSVFEGIEQKTDEMVTRGFAHKFIGLCRADWS